MKKADLLLYLLRHGESEGNVQGIFCSRLDTPLSADGCRQAELQAERLSAVPFSAFYSSPLLRARQTAAIVGERCGLVPTLESALEEVDLGLLNGQGLYDPRWRQQYDQTLAAWERGVAGARFPGGESLDAICERLHGFLFSLASLPAGRVLLVGHSLLFATAFWLFCENHPPTIAASHMGRGCLSIVARNDAHLRLLEFNIAPEAEQLSIVRRNP